MLVEYASLVAAMAVLTASLTGAFGQKLSVLPTSSGAAISTLNAAAGAQKVPKGGARTAYKTAPCSKPVLNYLYAVGWIGARRASSPASSPARSRRRPSKRRSPRSRRARGS